MSEVHDASQYISLPEGRAYYDLSWQVVSSLFVDACLRRWKVLYMEEEATDREILEFAEKRGQFEFLNDSAEDIYGLDDGEAV